MLLLRLGEWTAGCGLLLSGAQFAVRLRAGGDGADGHAGMSHSVQVWALALASRREILSPVWLVFDPWACPMPLASPRPGGKGAKGKSAGVVRAQPTASHGPRICPCPRARGGATAFGLVAGSSPQAMTPEAAWGATRLEPGLMDFAS